MILFLTFPFFSTKKKKKKKNRTVYIISPESTQLNYQLLKKDFNSKRCQSLSGIKTKKKNQNKIQTVQLYSKQ